MLAAAAGRAGLACALLAARNAGLAFLAVLGIGDTALDSLRVRFLAGTAEGLRKPFADAGPETLFRNRGAHRCGLGRTHRLHRGFFASHRLRCLNFALGKHGLDFLAQCQLVAGFVDVFVAAQTLNFVTRRLHALVGDDHDRRAGALLDGRNHRALFVEQEVCNCHRCMDQHPGSVVLHGLFLGQADDRQRQRFHGANRAVAFTAWAGDVAGFAQRGA